MWNFFCKFTLMLGIIGIVTLFKIYLIPDMTMGGQIIYVICTMLVGWGILASDENFANKIKDKE